MLNGTLDDFSVPDLFRLLSGTNKTGRLEVRRAAGSGAVYFNGGDVYYAESTLVKEPLGQRLVRAGAVGEGQLRKALDEHADSGERVGQILLASGAVTEDELQSAVRSQIEDAAFDLLQWEVGDFTWEPDVAVAVEIEISVSVENLIMEASRRLDELEVIMRKIPGGGAVPALAPTPPEGAIEINIAPDEWRTLVQVDGHRSVSEIAEAVGSDELTTMRTLYGLVSAGLLEVTASDDDEEKPFVRPDLGPIGSWPGEEKHEAEAEVTVPDEVVSTNGLAPGADVALAVENASDISYEIEPAANEHEEDVASPDMSEPAEIPEPFEPAEMPESSEPAEMPEPSEPAEMPEPSEPVSPAAMLLGELAAHPRLDSDAGEDGSDDEESGASAEAGPAIDRAAVVRELAGLFDERRARSDSESSTAGPPITPRRVEDDMTLNKGLIARLIDGVKGL